MTDAKAPEKAQAEFDDFTRLDISVGRMAWFSSG